MNIRIELIQGTYVTIFIYVIATPRADCSGKLKPEFALMHELTGRKPDPVFAHNALINRSAFGRKSFIRPDNDLDDRHCFKLG
ncbi:MAG: hypothetical protein CSB48_13535 [Proteobacteria bacterium]|nr:MAG: hypothetical protein CSB48_13535 [Pseudomonadota bacterium]PIE40490.1 MAG: hypothetical protein CSA51_00330 [Gammaproteobacteria bacterium]